MKTLAACAFFLLACSSDAKSVAPIEDGAAGGACYANGTCDGALVCEKNKCVVPDGG